MGRFPRLYPEDLEKLEKILNTLVKQSSGQAALFINPEGRCLAEGGAFQGGDRAEFCSQAHVFWREAEKLAGTFERKPPGFQFVPLEKVWICLEPASRGSLLVVLCENDATLGMVRLHSIQTLAKLKEVLDEIDERQAEGKRIAKDVDDQGPSWPGTPLPA